MSKRTYSIIALILVLSALLSCTAFAATTRASEQIQSRYSYITPKGNGVISITYSITGTDTMSMIGSSVIRLYKSNGALMKTYRYTTADYADMMGYNDDYHSGSVIYTGVAGNSYYALVTFYAENSSGADSRTDATSTVTAK